MFISNEDKKIVKKILLLYTSYKKELIFILVCVVASSGISLLLPLISKNIMDNGFIAKDFKVVILLALASLLLVILDQGIGMIETKYYAYLNSIVPYTLLKKAFKHTLKLKMSYFNNINTNELMSNIGMDVGNISRVSDKGTFYIISSICRMIGGVAGLIIIDWKLSMVILGVLPIRYIIVKKLAGKRRKIFENYMEINKNYAAWYGDTIGGIKEIKLWGIDRVKTGQFIKKQREIIKTNIKFAFFDKYNELSEMLLYQLITSLLYILGGYMIFHDSLTIGGLFALITYTAYVTGPISVILNIGYSFSNIIPSAKRLFEFFNLECEECKEDRGINCKTGNEIRGEIIFVNVSFAYKRDEPVLKDICLNIRQGEKVAIIGDNGSGKSTLVNLLLRFYKPDAGKILLDGTDIESINLRDYRKMISVVSQDLYLFNGTVNENIAISPGIKEFKVYKAAKQSTAHEFIEALPERYKSRVGRNGASLSGGERQKIAVARALVKDSKILIMDEATSNYDIKSEIRVNELIETELNDRTVLVISHRPEVLKRVDRIIMLDNGCIVDEGKHEELYGRNCIYRKLLESNMDEEKSIV